MRLVFLTMATLIATPALAGGLLSGGNTIYGGANAKAVTKKAARDAIGAYEKSAPEPGSQFAPLTTSEPEQGFDTYESLMEKKTEGQRKTEDDMSERFGQPVSNICLTSRGACEVSYTTEGSSCYCDAAGVFELGVVQ